MRYLKLAWNYILVGLMFDMIKPKVKPTTTIKLSDSATSWANVENPAFYNWWRDEILSNALTQAIIENEPYVIDVDRGCSSRMLQDVFKTLARQFGAETVLKFFKFQNEDDPFQDEEIVDYIKEAEK